MAPFSFRKNEAPAGIKDEAEFHDALSEGMTTVAALAAAQLSRPSNAAGAGGKIDRFDGQIRYTVDFADDARGGDFRLVVSTGRGPAFRVERDNSRIDRNKAVLEKEAGDGLTLDWEKNPEGARSSADVIREMMRSLERILAKDLTDRKDMVDRAA